MNIALVLGTAFAQLHTVEHSVRDRPKCKGKWSFPRGQITGYKELVVLCFENQN